jgi:hypothetical protein
MDVNLDDLRKRFLRAIDKQVPKALDEVIKIAPSLPGVERADGSRSMDMRLMDPIFINWAERFGFQDAWMRTQACNLVDPIQAGHAVSSWMTYGLIGAYYVPPRQALEVPGWSIDDESEQSFRRRVAGVVDDYIRARKLMRGYLVDGQGEWKLTRDFEWLALVHVGGVSRTEVANRSGVNESTVRSSLRSLAELIGLTLRKPKRGARRGTKYLKRSSSRAKFRQRSAPA